jgi:hypothetical protein
VSKSLTHTNTLLRKVGVGWTALRLLTSVLVAYASFWVPLTEFEQSVIIWPPSAPWDRGLRRLLLAPWYRWDVDYYRQIALTGYSRGTGTLQFHPLYPWLAAPLARWLDQALLPLLLISSLAGLLCWLALIQLGQLDFAEEDVWFGSLVWASFPVSFILFAPYSEALFLLWAVLCLLQARQHRWWLASGFGALAVLTRRQGLLLVLPLAWELWQSRRWDWAEIQEWFWDWVSLLCIPLTFGLWMGYRGLFLSDVAAEGRDFQSLVYSFLISPDAQVVVPVQGFFWPWQVLNWALQMLWNQGIYQHVLDLGLAGWFLLITAMSWRHLRPSYRLYVLAVILLSFSYYTGPVAPYMGLPRHLWLGFPVFIGVAKAVQKHRLRTGLLIVNVLLMAWMTVQYVFHVWVP